MLTCRRGSVVPTALDAIATVSGVPVDDASRAAIQRFHDRWRVHLNPMEPAMAAGVLAVLYLVRGDGDASITAVTKACGNHGSSLNNAVCRFLDATGVPGKGGVARAKAWFATRG